VIAVALATCALVSLFAGPLSSAPARGADVPAGLLVLAMTLPVAVIARHPRYAIAVAGGAALTLSLAGYGLTLGALFVWCLVGVAALLTDRRLSVLLGVASAVSVALSVAAFDPDNRGVATLALAAVVGTLPTFVGDAQRRQRALTEQVRRLQQAEVERALEAERVRIARDVHDTVGHYLSAISLQAQAGQVADPGTALPEIAQLSSRAIDDTREILGLLREPPGIERASDLIATAGLAGVDADVSIEGAVDDLPAAVSAAAFRVIQESLTNCAKHAPGARAHVTVRRADDRLRVEVSDGGGRGIDGMRERVEALGGALHAGPRADAPGWTVVAELPDAG